MQNNKEMAGFGELRSAPLECTTDSCFPWIAIPGATNNGPKAHRWVEEDLLNYRAAYKNGCFGILRSVGFQRGARELSEY